jgi:hypothetical protein
MSPAQVASLACTLAGLAAAWVATSVCLLYFDNLYGPFGEHGSLGALTALGCGAGAGIAVFYPPGVQDASSTRYCMGLENRIPNG